MRTSFYLEQVADHRTHRLVHADAIRHQSICRSTTARNKRDHQQAGEIYRHYDVQEHHKKRNTDCLKDGHSTIVEYKNNYSKYKNIQ